jgi:hypothetical protein
MSRRRRRDWYEQGHECNREHRSRDWTSIAASAALRAFQAKPISIWPASPSRSGGTPLITRRQPSCSGSTAKATTPRRTLTVHEAKVIVRELAGDQDTQGAPKNDRIAEWADAMRGRGSSRAAIKVRCETAGRALKDLGDHPARSDITKCLAQYDGWSRRSYFNHLSAYFRWEVEIGLREQHPMAKLKAPLSPRP